MRPRNEQPVPELIRRDLALGPATVHDLADAIGISVRNLRVYLKDMEGIYIGGWVQGQDRRCRCGTWEMGRIRRGRKGSTRDENGRKQGKCMRYWVPWIVCCVLRRMTKNEHR